MQVNRDTEIEVRLRHTSVGDLCDSRENMKVMRFRISQAWATFIQYSSALEDAST